MRTVCSYASIALSLLGMSLANADEALPDEVDIAVTTPEVTFQPDAAVLEAASGPSPITVSYRVIGTPLVGQPVALDLKFETELGARGFDVAYRINDMTALEFPESQSTRVSIAASADGQPSAQQVTVVPLREGRLFLNVAAIIEGDNGSTQHVTAIPIEVAKAPTPSTGSDDEADDS